MSLSELLNPSIGSKYWMNTYHNTVHTQGLQFGTSSIQGYVLGAIDTTGTIGLIPSGGTGGVGGVTNTDVTIAVTSTSSGGASIQATGKFPNGVTAGTGSFSALTATGNSFLTGTLFALSQGSPTFAFVGNGTTGTANGTSGVISITGFTLNNSATTILNILNSSVATHSVIMLTPNVFLLNSGSGVSNLVANISAVNPGSGYQFNLFNGSGVGVTGTLQMNYSLS